MILQRGSFYTQVLLHRDAVNTNMLVRAGALGRKYFYTGDDCAKRNLQTQARLHTGAFAQRCFYTSLFTCQYVYAVLLHTFFFTQRFIYTQVLLHGHTLTHTQRQVLLHTSMFNTVMVFYTSFFFAHTHTCDLPQGCLETQMLLCRDTCTQRCFFKKMLSHKETLLHTNTFTQR